MTIAVDLGHKATKQTNNIDLKKFFTVKEYSVTKFPQRPSMRFTKAFVTSNFVTECFVYV